MGGGLARAPPPLAVERRGGGGGRRCAAAPPGGGGAGQGEQLVTQRLAPWRVQRLEGAERRAVVGAEEIDVLLGGAEAEDRRAAVAGRGGGDAPEERVEVAFITPADGGPQAGRGGEV